MSFSLIYNLQLYFIKCADSYDRKVGNFSDSTKLVSYKLNCFMKNRENILKKNGSQEKYDFKMQKSSPGSCFCRFRLVQYIDFENYF